MPESLQIVRWQPSATFDATEAATAIDLNPSTTNPVQGVLRGARYQVKSQAGATTITIRLYSDSTKLDLIGEWINSSLPANDAWADRDFGGSDGPVFRGLYLTAFTDAGTGDVHLEIEIGSSTVDVRAIVTTAA